MFGKCVSFFIARYVLVGVQFPRTLQPLSHKAPHTSRHFLMYSLPLLDPPPGPAMCFGCSRSGKPILCSLPGSRAALALPGSHESCCPLCWPLSLIATFPQNTGVWGCRLPCQQSNTLLSWLFYRPRSCMGGQASYPVCILIHVSI